MSPSVAELLLQRLEREAAGPGGGLCSLEAAAALGLDHQTLVGAVKSLQALGEVGAPGVGPGQPRGAGTGADPGTGSRR